MLHYALWILFVIYVCFALVWAKRQTIKLLSEQDSIIWRIMILVLATLISPFGYARWLFLWPQRTREAHQQLAAAEVRRKGQSERDFREEKWIRENPPTLYYNTINGVTAVVRKDDYDKAKELHRRQIRDGLAGNPKILPLIRTTFLFYHASATQAPSEFQTGMLSEFDDLSEQKMAKVERRRDILVPFAAKDGNFSMTVGKDCCLPLHMPQGNEIGRVTYAVNYLLRVDIPEKVSFGS